MDHLGSSSSSNPRSQGEPFFDLLQPNSSSVYHGAQNSPPMYFANDDVLPSMDFQPIVDTIGKGKVDDSMSGWQSQPANSRNHAPSHEINVRSDKDAVESATVAAVEKTMKKYADNLLRVLEGMSGRLTQLESNSSRMEQSVDTIKVDAADNFGATDGKLRSLENMIREVQRSVQVMRDKQEIAEEQMKLEKLQLSAKLENSPPVVSSTPTVETIDAPLALPLPTLAVEPASLLQQQSQQLQSSAQQQMPQPPQQVQPQHQQLQGQPQIQQLGPSLLPVQHQQLQMQGPPAHPQHQQLHPQGQATPLQHQQLQAQGQNRPLPQPQQMQIQGMIPPQQQLLQLQGPPQASQMPPQSPQAQGPHPLPGHQQLQLQEPQYQSQQAPPKAPQSSQMQPFYGQPQQQGPPGAGAAMSQHYQEVSNPYATSQGSYNQELAPPQVPGGYELRFLPLPAPPPPSSSMGPMQHVPVSQLQLQHQQQQQHGQSGGQMFDSPRNAGGPPAALPGAYHPQGRDAPQAYNQYAPPQYRMAQPVSPAPAAVQGGGYQQLPTARPVQSSMGSQGGPPPVAANRVPVDEVIDKVAGMGFGRDQVRAVVRRLTENGTSVDLNIVLDKLMNGDSSARNDVQQPAKGWYGR